jgi:hypothetical protein
VPAGYVNCTAESLPGRKSAGSAARRAGSTVALGTCAPPLGGPASAAVPGAELCGCCEEQESNHKTPANISMASLFPSHLQCVVGRSRRRSPGGPARWRCRGRAGLFLRVALAVSEFGQLGVRRHEPHTARTEIHDQGGVKLDADDPAEAVLIVGNLIAHRELLSGRSDRWRAEGAGGQETPGRGAGCFHHYQYAPACGMRLPASGRSSASDPLVLAAGRWPRCLPISTATASRLVPDAHALCGYESRSRLAVLLWDGDGCQSLGGR